MNFRSLLKKNRLPEGYSVLAWKSIDGKKRYSVFFGDDRLMSFNTKVEALNYAIEIHNRKQLIK